jgi:hypothetical protein
MYEQVFRKPLQNGTQEEERERDRHPISSMPNVYSVTLGQKKTECKPDKR